MSQALNSASNAERAVREALVCAHCGLDVPGGLIEAGAERQFCCAGCRAVYAIVHGCGLEDYYRIRDRENANRIPARHTGRAFPEFDSDVYRARYVRPRADGALTTDLYLEGVTCAACVWLVERLPRVVPGVLEARLDLRRGLAAVAWAPGTKLSDIARGLDRLGYTPHPARGQSARDAQSREDRAFLIRIGVAGACAGNAMLLGLAMYTGMFNPIAWEHQALFRWTSMLVGLLALLWPGRVFLSGAWRALRAGVASLDIPIALGLLAAGSAGTVNTVLGRGEVYFDSLTVLVFLLLVGRLLQQRQQRRAVDAIELLFSLAPTSARRVNESGVSEEVAIEALQVGDVIETRAGESIAVDGEIISGASDVDQSLLTGESEPVAVDVGSVVCAGAVNLTTPIRVRATGTGEETRVAKLMRLIEENARTKSPLALLADRVAGWFVVAVLGVAAVVAAWWTLRAGFAPALDHAVALLIVACPCALGLATPLTVGVGLGRAARRGILIKGGDVFERLREPGLAVFDKTGTLTRGRLSVSHWRGDNGCRPLAAALERHATHSVAHALAGAWSDGETRVCEDIAQSRAGMSGAVAGQRVVVGAPAFVRKSADAPDCAIRFADQVAAEGASPIFVAIDGRVVGVAGLRDTLRPDAPGVIAALRERGWDIAILSGDHAQVVDRVGEALDIPPERRLGAVTPEGKLRFVEGERASRPVLMIGDGVNDAAAMSAATVGIAVRGGAEASLAAADVYVGRDTLTPIVELLDGANRAVRLVRWNLAVSLGYNAIAVTLAAVGLINPLVAAILMPVSSLTVLTLATAGRTFANVTPAEAGAGAPVLAPPPAEAVQAAALQVESASCR
ncbi:MAG: heavy metal translocating P-type ATPase [Phycisphaerales bacterium]|nr:heavy metal translocating P-type ATPase [Phycisphaerales bacterium]